MAKIQPGPFHDPLSTDDMEEIIYLSVSHHHYDTWKHIPQEFAEKALSGRIQEIRERDIVGWMETLPLMKMQGSISSPQVRDLMAPTKEMLEGLAYKSPDDKQIMAGTLCFRLRSLREAMALNYSLSDHFISGKEYIALVESVKGDELGEDLARRYGFGKFLEDEAGKYGKWIDVQAKWFVLTFRREGDAIIFFATSDTIPLQTYHIGVLWSPLWLAKKYQPETWEQEPPSLLH